MIQSFLALGDSYTAGEGVSAAGCWPAQLAMRLRGEGIDIGDPQVVAQTGWTSDELSAAMDEMTLAPPYALVTLLIGVNNQYRGWPLDEYREQFRALLNRVVELAGGEASRVVVVSIPDWGMTPLARREKRDPRRVAAEINAFNAAARVDVEAAGSRWVDVTAISRAATLHAELVADGLHPSAAQYTRWVGAVLPVARAVLTAA